MSDSHSNSGALGLGRRRFIGLVSSAYLGSANARRADHHVISAEPFEVEFDLASATSRYTPVYDFYVRDHFPVPAAAPSSIEISGSVEQPIRLGPSELGALKRVELGAVLECAGNPVSTNALVSNGLWGGWRLADVVVRARPAAASTHVLLYGRDRYSRVIPMSRLAEGAMLVCDLNGAPLQRSHGGPWRAFFPGWYGMDSVKWLERIVILKEAPADASYSYHQIRRDATGIRTQPLPRIQVKSIITAPRAGTSCSTGNIQVRGLAWSGSGQIETVELSSNGGAHWQRVPFENRPPGEWISWNASVEARSRGALELMVRARDSSGQTQPQRPDPVRIDRYANNWLHRVRVAVV